jgi:hypothetical protein
MEIKNKIEKCISLYKTIDPEEFDLAKDAVREQARKQYDQGKAYKGSDVIERLIVSFPEKLFNLFMNNMNEEELAYLNSSDGIHWFAKEFPEFSIPDKENI